jgi:hypothetical protein
MDPLLPRKPQDIDRWSDEAEREPTADVATGPNDRWANEAARADPDYPAADAGEGSTSARNVKVEDDGNLDTQPEDPGIHREAK